MAMVEGSKLYQESARWLDQRDEAKMQRTVLEKKISVLTMESRAMHAARSYVQTEQLALQDVHFEYLKQLKQHETAQHEQTGQLHVKHAKRMYAKRRANLDVMKKNKIDSIQSSVEQHHKLTQAAFDRQHTDSQQAILKTKISKHQVGERRQQSKTLRSHTRSEMAIQFTKSFVSLNEQKKAQDLKRQTELRTKLVKTNELRAEARNKTKNDQEKKRNDIITQEMKSKAQRRHLLSMSVKEFESSTSQIRSKLKQSKAEFEATKALKLSQLQRAGKLRTDNVLDAQREQRSLELERHRQIKMNKCESEMLRQTKKNLWDTTRFGETKIQQQMSKSHLEQEQREHDTEKRLRMAKHKATDKALQSRLDKESKLVEHIKRSLKSSNKKPAGWTVKGI